MRNRNPKTSEFEAKAKVYGFLAGLFKTLANPTRLKILAFLSDNDQETTEKAIEIPKEPSWQDVEKWTIKLARKMSDFKPDFVIGVSRGGWIPAVLLSRIIGGWSLIPIDIEKIHGERRVKGLFALSPAILAGKNVLLVEDITETGKSLIVAREFLEKNGAAVKVACFFTRDISEIKPDFVITEGLIHGIIFPWEKIKDKT